MSELLIILLLVILNGLFSGAEIALVSVRRTRLRELAEQGSTRARVAGRLRDTPERLLATVQIGITVVGATAAAYGGDSLAEPLGATLASAGAGRYAHDLALFIIIASIAFLSLVLGELVPKSLALRYAEGIALAVARPLAALAWLARPLVWFLTWVSNLILRLFGDKTSFSEARHSPEELQQLVEESAKAGALDPRVADIASHAFELSELTVLEVMVPSTQIVALRRDADTAEIQRVLLEGKHSRLPVYDGQLDNIVGFIIAKDVLAIAWQPKLSLETIIRPAYYVPTTARALDVLKELQRRHMHMAIVVFEDATVAGLVTVEDLVEELVGDIFAEHDKPPQLVRGEVDGTFVIQATTSIRDANRRLPFELPVGEDYATVAGLVSHLAGEIPPSGRVLQTPAGLKIEVVEASPRRVRSVRVTPPPTSRDDDDDGQPEG